MRAAVKTRLNVSSAQKSMQSSTVTHQRFVAQIVMPLTVLEILHIVQIVWTALLIGKKRTNSFLTVAKGAHAALDKVVCSGVRIVQVNLNHCSDANTALEDYSVKNVIDIFLVQDPYIFNNSIAGIPSHWRSFSSLNFSSSILITNKDYYII